VLLFKNQPDRLWYEQFYHISEGEDADPDNLPPPWEDWYVRGPNQTIYPSSQRPFFNLWLTGRSDRVR
jgi:hypothetical protein